jgi:hypothetical protein
MVSLASVVLILANSTSNGLIDAYERLIDVLWLRMKLSLENVEGEGQMPRSNWSKQIERETSADHQPAQSQV